MTRSQAAISGLQGCLAIEHEALWLYAYVGARVTAISRQAHDSYESHRKSRDVLIAMLHDSQASLPAPATDYASGNATSPSQARAIVRSIEAKVEAANLVLVGSSEGLDREFALKGLRRAALASLAWGGAPVAFPGLPA
ncbi:MAG: DUF4439 domain-containing protein [Aeromicrobium sp.]